MSLKSRERIQTFWEQRLQRSNTITPTIEPMADVEIELVGGPRDGERLHVPSDGPVPAPRLEMTTVDRTDAGLDVSCLVYRRDDRPVGELWHYRYETS